MPNIPARYTPVGSYSNTARDVSPSVNTPSNELAAGLHRPSLSVISVKRPTSSSADNTTVDLEGLPAEDKARVLRRHLLLHGERASRTDLRSSDGSDQDAPDVDEPSADSSSPLRPAREASDAFPIPYHAPGADVTSVFSITSSVRD